MHCRDILFTPRYSPRAREFLRSVNFSLRRTVAELRGVRFAQLSDFGLFSPYKTPKTYLPVTSYSPGVTSQNDYDFSTVQMAAFRDRRFSATSSRGAGDPQTCPNFRLWQMAIPIHNATRGVRFGPKMSENAQFWRQKYFPTKYLRNYPQNHPKPRFGGPFNGKPIIQRALRQSHVNGATTLKLYSYIGIGKYLGLCQNLSARGRLGAQGPLM